MPPVLRHRHRTLEIDHGTLVENAVSETYLTADAASGGSTASVKNITGFAVSQVILLGELGEENAEVILLHASSAPSGTTITFASNLVRTHAAGTRVRALLFNQFELSHADTATGSKTVLTVSGGEPPSSLGTGLVAIDPTQRVQKYRDTSETTGFYFARYYHSIDTAFGNYTDALAYGGWAANTAGYIINAALRRLGVSISEKLTWQTLIDEMNECLRFIQGKQIRWPKHYSDNAIIGQTARGIHELTLPSDIYDDNSNKSINAVRIGDSLRLQYRSPSDFEDILGTALVTQVRTAASANDTTLAVDNSYDFADSGSVSVYVSGTKYTITYTGITRDDAEGATAVFSGIPASGTGSITVTIPVDTNVWQNEEEGEPLVYTVRNGKLAHWPLANGSNDNENVYMDYSTVATSVDSDGDEIDSDRYDMVLDYLTWKIHGHERNDGVPDLANSYYLSFKEKLNDAIRTLKSGRMFRMIPNINTMNWRGRKRTKYSDPTT